MSTNAYVVIELDKGLVGKQNEALPVVWDGSRATPFADDYYTDKNSIVHLIPASKRRIANDRSNVLLVCKDIFSLPAFLAISAVPPHVMVSRLSLILRDSTPARILRQTLNVVAPHWGMIAPAKFHRVIEFWTTATMASHTVTADEFSQILMEHSWGIRREQRGWRYVPDEHHPQPLPPVRPAWRTATQIVKCLLKSQDAASEELHLRIDS